MKAIIAAVILSSLVGCAATPVTQLKTINVEPHACVKDTSVAPKVTVEGKKAYKYECTDVTVWAIN